MSRLPIPHMIENLQSGIAIIVDGDTASQAVPSGGYAYIKNNTHGLTEGLYTAIVAFPTSGGVADSTSFRATPNVLGKIQEKVLFDTERFTYYRASPKNGTNFTGQITETLEYDGLYLLSVQINAQDNGYPLAIKIGNFYLAIHRTTGNQYENASALISLKKGTVVTYSYDNPSVQCQVQSIVSTY